MLDINFRQALTEVSVLSDVLQIVHNHRQYLSLDPVYVNKRYTLPPSYQYQIKKKVSILYDATP